MPGPRVVVAGRRRRPRLADDGRRRRTGASLRALAFDVADRARSGQRRSLPPAAAPTCSNPKNSHASPTPIVEGDRVYVHFGADGTAALTTTGEIVWKARFPYESQHGNGGSPVLYGDLLIFSCDGSDDGVRRRARQADRQGPLEDAAAAAVRPGLLDAARDPRRRPRPARQRRRLPRGRLRSATGQGDLARQLRATASRTCRGRCSATASSTSPPGFSSRRCWRCAPTARATSRGPTSPGRCSAARRSRRRRSLVGDELYIVNDVGIASCLDAQTGATHWRAAAGRQLLRVAGVRRRADLLSQRGRRRRP